MLEFFIILIGVFFFFYFLQPERYFAKCIRLNKLLALRKWRSEFEVEENYGKLLQMLEDNCRRVKHRFRVNKGASVPALREISRRVYHYLRRNPC